MQRNIEGRSHNHFPCVCSLNYSARKGHVLCCSAICGLSGCTVFFHIITFGKEVFEDKMCYDFLCNFFSETFLIPRRIQRDVIPNVHRSSCKVPATLTGF